MLPIILILGVASAIFVYLRWRARHHGPADCQSCCHRTATLWATYRPVPPHCDAFTLPDGRFGFTACSEHNRDNRCQKYRIDRKRPQSARGVDSYWSGIDCRFGPEQPATGEMR